MEGKDLITEEQAEEIKWEFGRSLTRESLLINRLAATVIALYLEVRQRPLGLDKEIITTAAHSQLDWLTRDQVEYAAEAVIEAIVENENG